MKNRALKKISGKKMTRKKGEITSGQLVLIFILIISFVIILYPLYGIYNWNPVIDRESCHESIVFRSSVNWEFIKASKVVPLKCQSERICMTMSKEDCPQVGKNSKDNPVTKINLDKDPLKARQQIIGQFSESMRECHSMLGEGQLLFMPNNVLGGEKFWDDTNYCLICARIVFDKEARQKIQDIKYTELYQVLGSKLLPDKKTYLEYLHPDWKDWHSVWRLFQKLQEDSKENSKFPELANMKIEDWKININEEGGFVVAAQIAPKAYFKSFIETGLAIGVTALAATGIGAPFAVTMSAVAGGVTFWYSSPTGEFFYSPPGIQPYNLESLQGMNCDSFEIAL